MKLIIFTKGDNLITMKYYAGYPKCYLNHIERGKKRIKIIIIREHNLSD